MTNKSAVYGVPSDQNDRNHLQETVANYALTHRLVPPLSMDELREYAQQIDAPANLFDYVMVLLNNEVWRETIAGIPYERRLLLLPQCLRDAKNCPAEMDEFGLLCEECGRCCIGELQSMAEDLGYVVLVAEGSTVVSKLLVGGKVDAVVGVSCLQALEKSFPQMADGAIPGLAIPLSMDGCINTTVDLDRIREAILLKSDKSAENRVDTVVIRAQVDQWFSTAPKLETGTEKIAYDWLMSAGKRWRPYLLACTYSALKDGTQTFPEDVYRLAMATECFHKASLAHDDIEDDDDLRYGEPTLHVKHGLGEALNAGDLLVGEGYRWISECEHYVPALLRVAAENHRMLCIGQGEELSGLAQGDLFSAEQIIEIFRRKTAPAFGVSIQLGAIAASESGAVLEHLSAFSESLGIAYQIKDDLEEYLAGETVDLRASILLALANDQRVQERVHADDPDLAHIFDELMVVEKARQLLEHYKNKAIRALNPLNNDMLKSLLRRVTFRILSGA